MILKVLTYPDPRLRHKAVPVAQMTEELRALARNMLETMEHENGIGLAAPQVGESVSLVVIDTRPFDDDGHPTTEGLTELEIQIAQPLILFNPKILSASEKTNYEEGCLSVPGFFETVERARLIEVEGLGYDGRPLRFATDGLLAICIQHEMDHLDGKLFIDRLSFVKSTRIKSRIKKQGYPTPEEVAEARAEARRLRAERKLAQLEAKGSKEDSSGGRSL